MALEMVQKKTRQTHTAYVLVNCDLGYEAEVLDQIRDIGNVAEAHVTSGAYDIIVQMRADSIEELRDAITWKIRKLERVRSTLTLKDTDGQD